MIITILFPALDQAAVKVLFIRSLSLVKTFLFIVNSSSDNSINSLIFASQIR